MLTAASTVLLRSAFGTASSPVPAIAAIPGHALAFAIGCPPGITVVAPAATAG